MADPLVLPRGLSRPQAAAYIGVGTTLFDRLVLAGTMPRPREIGGRRVWDRQEVDRAFEELPYVGDEASARNPWDAILDIEDPPAKGAMTYTVDDGGHLPNAYTPASLAERWSCSERHVRRMVKSGDLEGMALGGKLLRITRDVVEAYEARNDGAAPPAVK